MRLRFLTIPFLICLILPAASAQSVNVDYDHSLSFSQYRTFAWTEQPNPNQIRNPLLAQEAKTQIDSQLQSRGLQLIHESENPDLIVVASGGMKTEISYNSWGGMGGWRFGGAMGTTTPERNVIGTLVVDLYDSKAKKLAWRGTAQGTLNESNSEKNRQLVIKAVSKLFRKYPYPEKNK
jgi:hypothetical protein